MGSARPQDIPATLVHRELDAERNVRALRGEWNRDSDRSVSDQLQRVHRHNRMQSDNGSDIAPTVGQVQLLAELLSVQSEAEQRAIGGKAPTGLEAVQPAVLFQR